jgi:hypothetical protein
MSNFLLDGSIEDGGHNTGDLPVIASLEEVGIDVECGDRGRVPHEVLYLGHGAALIDEGARIRVAEGLDVELMESRSLGCWVEPRLQHGVLPSRFAVVGREYPPFGPAAHVIFDPAMITAEDDRVIEMILERTLAANWQRKIK